VSKDGFAPSIGPVWCGAVARDFLGAEGAADVFVREAEAPFELDGPATGPETDAELERVRTPELGPATLLGSTMDG